MSEKFQDIDYASRCSEKTLQTNDEGFFLSFADNLAEIAGKTWIEKTFGKLKSDRDRMMILYKYEPIKNTLTEVLSNVRELYRRKSSEKAAACRKEAEKSLNQNNLMKTLSLFSQSVLRAEKTGYNRNVDNGNSLSLGLYGRSKVLMEMEKFDFALNDIQLALKENLPDNFKGEAYLNLAVCYKALNEDKKASVAFGLAQKLLNEDKLLASYRNEMSSTRHFRKGKEENKELPKISGILNQVFPKAINKLDVKSTPYLGRHVVSKGKIRTGETLVVEPPEAACLVIEAFGTHCHNCFERLTAPIGCPTCSNVAFCCVPCKDQSLKSYHKYECKILELLLGSGMSILSHLALRMVTQKELTENLRIYDNRIREHIFSLCTNSEKRSARDFFRRSVMAAFLLRCLQKTGYFDFSNDSVIPTEDEITIGELLLFNLQMLQFNAHEIYEKIHPANHRFKGSKLNYIGVGLYPTVALFNHQCYPSVTRYFVGKNIVVNAIKSMFPGDIVAENYGPIFTKKPLQVRQKSLMSRYWFKCECVACTQNWPMVMVNVLSDEGSSRIRCPNKECRHIFTLPIAREKLECVGCKKEVNLKESIEKLKWCENQYYIALQKMDAMKPIEGIQILEEALDTFHIISIPPHKPTHIAEETLKACYADLGNTFASSVKINV